MGFDVYVAGYPLEPHERKQVNKLLREFHLWFSNSSSNCTAIIGLEIPNAQIDLLLLKDNRLIVVELKNYSGPIMADCSSEDKLWTGLSDGKQVSLGTTNPYFQARRERLSLAKFLRKGIIRDQKRTTTASYYEPDPLFGKIVDNISAWVVLNDDAAWEVTG